MNTIDTTNTIYTNGAYRRLFNGLDLTRYRVLQVIPVTLRSAVIIMRGKDTDPTPYCLQYGGSGRYFKTVDDLKAYYAGRFRQELTIAA